MKNVFTTTTADRYLNKLFLEKIESLQNIQFSLIEHEKEG